MEELKQQTTKGAKQPELPIKKHNSPLARILCWKCKELGAIVNRRPLIRFRDGNGKKTNDYVCDIHLMLGIGRPAIGNQSMLRFAYRQEAA